MEDRRGKSPGSRSLAGPTDPDEGCGLWPRIAGAGGVMAGSTFQTQRVLGPPSEDGVGGWWGSWAFQQGGGDRAWRLEGPPWTGG